MSETKPRCKNLVLDAGPLLSLSPLRGLAETYFTVPQVLEELKDKQAREHFERLGLSAGVRVEVRSPDATSIAHVIQFAKKTGDYSVLSHADICVLALTYSLDNAEKEASAKEGPEKQSTVSEETADSHAQADHQNGAVEADPSVSPIATDKVSPHTFPIESAIGKLQIADAQGDSDYASSSPGIEGETSSPPSPDVNAARSSLVDPGDNPAFEDPSVSDDGEGEWITPDNVALHKSRALDLLPSEGESRKRKGKEKEKGDEIILAGCMTADFAMQNVLLQMSLSLVGVEGKRIKKVKTWVLRCHACFKICKDNSKKFCPSCGNPTLLRASVTLASPDANDETPVMQIHLKRNFQYNLRGTKYSIPAPKSGSAKHGSGEGLILREDQTEYMRARKRADGKRQRDEQKMLKGLVSKGGESGVNIGSWMDPDWMPEILSVGTGGKGRTLRSGDIPPIGHGRKNPNERRTRH